MTQEEKWAEYRQKIYNRWGLENIGQPQDLIGVVLGVSNSHLLVAGADWHEGEIYLKFEGLASGNFLDDALELYVRVLDEEKQKRMDEAVKTALGRVPEFGQTLPELERQISSPQYGVKYIASPDQPPTLSKPITAKAALCPKCGKYHLIASLQAFKSNKDTRKSFGKYMKRGFEIVNVSTEQAKARFGACEWHGDE